MKAIINNRDERERERKKRTTRKKSKFKHIKLYPLYLCVEKKRA
jgi:hypothetical protein